jgi:hypothetical protein
MRKLQIKWMLLFIAEILLFVGCVPEMKIGSEYLSQRRNMTLVIRAPQWVKMVNLSADSISGRSELSQRQKDSIKFYKSKILKNITDSILIDNYITSLKSGFERQGYKTLIASENDSVFPVKGNAFLINIGQIELDEQKYPIRDETRYNSKLYTADYDLTKIELCYWIEVSKIENGISTQTPRMLYDSYNGTDYFDGHFALNQKDNKLIYLSKVEEITPEYIDSVATTIGSDHAFRLNEYLLNEYISYFLPQKQNRILLGVNQKFGTLLRVYEPPFKEIQE